YIKARAEASGLKADGGLIERAERLILGLAGTGLEGFGVPYAVEGTLWLLAVLSVITLAQRMLAVAASAREERPCAGRYRVAADPPGSTRERVRPAPRRTWLRRGLAAGPPAARGHDRRRVLAGRRLRVAATRSRCGAVAPQPHPGRAAGRPGRARRADPA